jgi:hypothetical protein
MPKAPITPLDVLHIAAVADAYEAMTADRPYGPALGHDAARRAGGLLRHAVRPDRGRRVPARTGLFVASAQRERAKAAGVTTQ